MKIFSRFRPPKKAGWSYAANIKHQDYISWFKKHPKRIQSLDLMEQKYNKTGYFVIGATKKLHLITEIIKIENEVILIEIEALITESKLQASESRSFTNFSGTLSDEETDEWKKSVKKESSR